MKIGVAARQRSPSQPTAIATAAIVLAALWIYRDTVASLITVWGQSQTFAHGYWVPVIVLWLLWRQRAVLAALAPSFAPSPSALLAVAALGLVWLVGDLAEVNPARQFALVGMLVLTVPLLAGWRTAQALMFPLGFLFFAVPFGEFMLPWLMDRTADFTVLALRASGVPVYRDGMQMIIPTGTWSVVEACSGIRYLIASLMVGALFAYLHYRTTRRRLWFMLVALAVPIVANWVRAYMIVMIGHLSNNTLAVGVDHLIYGWVFFGVVIAIMFAIGMRWSEPPLEPASSASVRAAGVAPRSQRPLWSAAAGMVVLLAAPPLVLGSLTAAEDQNAPRLSAPVLDGPAMAADRTLPDWAPVYVNPSATVTRQYTVQSHPVGLFIAYYRGQGPRRRLVSSVNSLVTSGDLAWAQVGSGTRQVALGDRSIVARTASVRRRYVASFDAATLAVRQIYWVNGTFVAGDAQAKALAAWHRLLGRGDDGAVVIVYTLEQKPGDADALLDAFMRDHLGAIDVQLRKTRDGD
jgi:exosortase A